MRDARSVIGLLGALVVASAALFVAGPAQAAPPETAAHVHVLPAAPAGATARSAAAVSPTSSPAVRTAHGNPGDPYTCASGTLCAVVWDPTTGDYKQFFFYNCARYYLSNWNGTGNFYDAQTGGVTSYFYGQSGNVLRSFTPDFTNHDQDWGPVWSIRNC
ncbi:hypothetical protein QZN11_23555 [Streptomyces gramineus]|uniref:hypothetical protein n=1 Tax=Streptomyces gramineus TaxID=910542 RepID=UPI00398B7E0E